MTIKEAILKSLEEKKALSTHWDILKHIQQNNYYDLKIDEIEVTIKKILKKDKTYYERRNYKRVKKEFQLDFCDNFFKNDTEITAYCKSKNIPVDSNE